MTTSCARPKRSALRGRSSVIARSRKYLKDMEDLKLGRTDHYVRATDHIPEMLEITQALIDKGHAYESGGNVYFSVASDPSSASSATSLAI